MGKHSGRNALSTRLTQLGFDLTPQEVDDVFRRFKVCASCHLSLAAAHLKQGALNADRAGVRP
jgi:isopropylmalate/homocitrate/citramalate synthase